MFVRALSSKCVEHHTINFNDHWVLKGGESCPSEALLALGNLEQASESPKQLLVCF